MKPARGQQYPPRDGRGSPSQSGFECPDSHPTLQRYNVETVGPEPVGKDLQVVDSFRQNQRRAAVLDVLDNVGADRQVPTIVPYQMIANALELDARVVFRLALHSEARRSGQHLVGKTAFWQLGAWHQRGAARDHIA